MSSIYLITKPLNFGKPVDPRHIIACKTTLADAQEEHKIICIAAADMHAAHIRGPYTDETELEAFVMLQSGMEILTADEVIQQLDELGYRINNSMSFNYFNTSNERKYKARFCYIIEKDSGLSFGNADARRDENFKTLQALRRYSFGWNNGRIWEL